ncbi:30S ribosomal protein S8 [Patescibacteria group bacterium]|nr:MAG: 30S ribosomal protein S8 [Patescibacteria group bacterium]
MMTDPIADMLTRIRNAAKVRKPDLTLPYSRMKLSIAQILVQEGFIAAVETRGENIKKELRLVLKYDGRESTIHGVSRVSTPGRRVYIGYKEIPQVRSGYGVAILSTPSGIMSGAQARKQKVGGELLCEVY